MDSSLSGMERREDFLVVRCECLRELSIDGMGVRVTEPVEEALVLGVPCSKSEIV